MRIRLASTPAPTQAVRPAVAVMERASRPHAGRADDARADPPRWRQLGSALGGRVAILAAHRERLCQLLPSFSAAGFDENPAHEDMLAAPSVPAIDSTPGQIQAFAAAIVPALCDVFLVDGELPAPYIDTLLLALHARGAREVCVMVILPGDHPPRQIARLLQAGADDYLSWRLAPVLLRAKLDAAVRRARHHAPTRDCEVYGEYVFDLTLHEVCIRRERVHLTPKEFNLGLLLFRHQAQPLSRQFLQQQVWPHDRMLSTRTIDTHASVVRAKLQLRPENGYRLKTVYGFGYRLERVSEAERRALALEAGARSVASA